METMGLEEGPKAAVSPGLLTAGKKLEVEDAMELNNEGAKECKVGAANLNYFRQYRSNVQYCTR